MKFYFKMVNFHKNIGILLLFSTALQTQAQTVAQSSKQVSIDSIIQKTQNPQKQATAILYDNKLGMTEETGQDNSVPQDSTFWGYGKISGVDQKEIKMILPQTDTIGNDGAKNILLQIECNGKYWKAKQH